MSASSQSNPKKSKVQGYHQFLSGIQQVLEQARHQAARSVNAVLTAAYWEIGRRIVVYEQRGQSQTVSEKSQRPVDVLEVVAKHCPLPWSVYVRLLSVKSEYARQFYEAEALRGGWSVRQLDRQIDSRFYERVALSRNKAAMLKKGAVRKSTDRMTPDEEIKDPYTKQRCRGSIS